MTKPTIIANTSEVPDRKKHPGLFWPLKHNIIRRSSPRNTYGPVRMNADQSPRNHQGIDLYTPPGYRCYAIHAGTIVHVASGGDYGLVVVLEFVYNGRKLYAAYCHLSKALCKVGDKVAAGAVIAHSGNSGNAASMRDLDQHLHFEIRTVATPGRGLTGRMNPQDLYGYIPMTLVTEDFDAK